MELTDGSVVNLFWTGGWDSTFRLLQVLFILKKKVQPYYIIDEDRLSTGIEIRTIKIIKEKLFERYPETRSLVLPTIFKEVYDILPNQELTNKYNKILEHWYAGPQYEWMARFCSETGIEEIEVCIEKEGRAYGFLKTFVMPSGTEKDTYYKLNEKYRDTDEYGIFHFFSFPLFNITKLEMQNIAKNNGFEDFLELTWFCHTPRNYNRPCGVCTPCGHAIEIGLGKRVPFLSRIRYYCRNRNRIIRLLKKYPKYFQFFSRSEN